MLRVEGLEDTRSAFQKEKESEAQQEAGELLALTFTLPDGTTAQHRFPAGATVAYVKSVIEQHQGIACAKQVLTLGATTLLDPLCLLDHKVAQGAQIAVTVKQ